MIKIAITDDHPLLLEGLRNILSNQPNLQVVDCYSSSNQLQEALKTTEIDILLLDINLSDTNSIELIKPFKKNFPEHFLSVFRLKLQQILNLASYRCSPLLCNIFTFNM